MLAVPSHGPSVMPANNTNSVCSVIGTGVPGTGTAIRAPTAVANAKPTTPAACSQTLLAEPAVTDENVPVRVADLMAEIITRGPFGSTKPGPPYFDTPAHSTLQCRTASDAASETEPGPCRNAN